MDTNKKYHLTDETIVIEGRTLHRIVANTDFDDVKIGDLGGFVESEKNLSQNRNAWVYGDARVYGDAQVYGDALVWGDARVYGDALVCGNAWVCGNAEIKSTQDYIVFKNWWSSGRYFTWTRSNNKYKVGCFYGTGDELIKKAYQDSKTSGCEYERIVKYVESILNNN